MNKERVRQINKALKYDLEFVRNEEEAEHYPIRSTKSDFELFRELRDNFLKSERGVVEI